MTLIGRIGVPAVLCGIGIMGAIADTWLVRTATRGNGMTSDPGYYERALAWDDEMEAKTAAKRLGVEVTAELTRVGERRGRLCVGVHDTNGDILEGTRMMASASANLCPRARVDVALEQTGEGHCGMVADPCAGVWIIEARGEVMGEVIAATARTELRVTP